MVRSGIPHADPDRRREYQREYQRQWARENRDKRRQYERSWDERNRERRRAIEKRKRQRNPEKVRAGNTLRRAIYAGKIERQPCEVCGDPKSQAHHDDYSKPLEVRWLCQKHHSEHHREHP